MTIAIPSTSDVDTIVDQWVALAHGQREHDSHISPESNRAVIREAALQHIVAEELLVAREGDGIVGFVMFTIENGQYDQDVRRGIIQNLYVHPGHRNQGTGGALLEEAETHLAQQGADRVALNVMAKNQDALRFYRRHGYDPHRVELEKPVESDTL